MKRLYVLVPIILSLQLCLAVRTAQSEYFEKEMPAVSYPERAALSRVKSAAFNQNKPPSSGSHNPKTSRYFREEGDPPTNLSATTIGNNVYLSWHSPEAPSDILFEEDFEGYQDFSTAFAPWVLRDLDLGSTYSYVNVDWPGAGLAMAYMIFNPLATTPPLGDFSVHSGDKIAASFSSVSPPNNDWMISAPFDIQGGYRLHFWARSFTAQYGLERFKVGISSGSTVPADFTIISGPNPIPVPAAWTLYSYDLSAYAGQNIRFAIRCVSDDAFIFCVDDIFITADAPARPVTREFLGYKIYRDDVLIDTIPNSFTTMYEDLDLEDGIYSYSVSALYSSGESAMAGPVQVSICNLAPPLDLTASVAGYDVSLSWSSPASPQQGSWISWNQNDIDEDYAIGTGSPVIFDVASMYDATDLIPYQGGNLTKVKFKLGYEDCIYTVKIWGGGTESAPGTLLYSGVAHDISTVEWNTHILSDAIAIPADRLWIGYEINTQGGWPARCDAGPAVEGKGNLINLDGWTTLTQMGLISGGNWLIQGFVATASTLTAISFEDIAGFPPAALADRQTVKRFEPYPQFRSLLGYQIFRNDVLIATLSNPEHTSYTDMNLPQGNYLYGVKALYNEGESPLATAGVSVYEPLGPAIFADGFEDYPDFATDLSPWTTRTFTGGPTWMLPDYVFPGNGSDIVYMAFNPSATIPPMTDNSPMSGNKMAACFASTGGFNSDWLVSPRILLPENGTLRFYAKSHSASYGLERFRVGVNTMPTFVPQGTIYLTGPDSQDYVQAPTQWAQYNYDLSAYANQSVYICIRCVSENGHVFYVDDFSVHSQTWDDDDDPFGQPAALPASMDLAAAVSINGQEASSGDVLAAFVNVNGSPQLRGKGILNTGHGVAGGTLQIYTATNEETVYFKLWQRSTNEMFYAPITLSTVVSGNVGAWPDEPFLIDTQAIAAQNMLLRPGWNLISLNIAPQDGSWQTLLYPIADNVLQVKGTQGIYIPDNPFSPLAYAEQGQAYTIKVDALCDWSATGFRIASNTPIALADGWNLCAYLPSSGMPVSDALLYTSPWLLQVKGRDGVYIPDNPYSTLVNMHPGQGYWFEVSGAHQFIYPEPARGPKMDMPAKPFVEELRELPLSLVLLARCDWADAGDVLIARVDNEVRGAQELIAPEGFPAALMQIYINEADEEISLWLRKPDGAELPIANKFYSRAGQELGKYPAFVSLEAQPAPGDAPQLSTRLISCYPNPFNPSTTISFSIAAPQTQVSIKIYNLRGQMVARLTEAEYSEGSHQILFHGTDHKGAVLSSGVYIIELKAGSYRQTAKVMLAK